jgi:hypothetical protein
MTIENIALTLVVVASSACVASGDPAAEGDVEVIDLAEAADAPQALGPSHPRVALLLGCSGATGCSFDAALSLRSVGASEARVEVRIGRDIDALTLVDTITVAAGTETRVALPVSVPPHAGEGRVVSTFEPSRHVLLQLVLLNPANAAVTYEGGACSHDAAEASGAEERLFDGNAASGYALSSFNTIHAGDDVDVYVFDVVDGYAPDLGVRFGRIVDVGINTHSSSIAVEATYTCTDGTVLPIERYTNAAITGQAFGLDPDCPGLDDSGQVRITVRDPSATAFSCPRYVVSAEAQPGFL